MLAADHIRRDMVYFLFIFADRRICKQMLQRVVCTVYDVLFFMRPDSS